MSRVIIAAILFFVVRTFAYVPSKEAHQVTEFVKDGILHKVYMQEVYADEYQYCSQIITLKYDVQTGELLSSESKETCNRIR